MRFSILPIALLAASTTAFPTGSSLSKKSPENVVGDVEAGIKAGLSGVKTGLEAVEKAVGLPRVKTEKRSPEDVVGDVEAGIEAGLSGVKTGLEAVEGALKNLPRVENEKKSALLPPELEKKAPQEVDKEIEYECKQLKIKSACEKLTKLENKVGVPPVKV